MQRAGGPGGHLVGHLFPRRCKPWDATARDEQHSTMWPKIKAQGKGEQIHLCLETKLKALHMSTFSTAKSSSSQCLSMHALRPCTTFSVPEVQATQTEETENILRSLYFIKEHKHFPVILLNASPTAIGLTSGRQPGLDLFRAVKLPPASEVETVGT